MKSFSEKERMCELVFEKLGVCWHLWTPEGFQIIFDNEKEYGTGMCIIGICAMMFPDVIILTFELMSNHLHICAAGSEARIREMFTFIRMYLEKHMKSLGKSIDWSRFEPGIRRLETLDDVRNVIVYDNRNGYLVHPEHTPFTYPWGANRYFFNEDAKELERTCRKNMPARMKRMVCHSHDASKAEGLMLYNGYASPLSFCRIDIAEQLFRDASHYFYKLGKSIEANARIAKEIQESIYYTDDEINDVIYRICRERYNVKSPSLLNSNAKIEMAKMLRYDYNASAAQIERRLRLDGKVVESLFGTR